MLVTGKFLGVLRRMAWPFALVVAHFSAFTLCGVLSPWALAIVLWVTVAFIMPWIATGLYLSLRCKKVTTAVVVNLLLPVVAYAVAPMALAMLDSLTPGYGNHAELVLYYLPWWYLGEGVDRFHWTFDWAATTYVGGQRVTLMEFVIYLVVAGLFQVAVSAVLLWWMAFRFNRLVKRADG
jgi:hypothetical protein